MPRRAGVRADRLAVRIVSFAALALIASLAAAPKTAATGQDPQPAQAGQTCAVAAPTVKSTPFNRLVWIEAETTLTCSEDLPITWEVQYAKTCSAQPDHDECGPSGGNPAPECNAVVSDETPIEKVTGNRSDEPDVFITIKELENFALHGFRIRASITHNGTTVNSPWNPQTGCHVFEPVPPRPPSPLGLKAHGLDSKVVMGQATIDPACLYMNVIDDHPITKWQYRYKCDGCEWGTPQDIDSQDSDMPQVTVTGLVNGTQYAFQVRAVAYGTASLDWPGVWSDAVVATPRAPVSAPSPPPSSPPSNPGSSNAGSSNAGSSAVGSSNAGSAPTNYFTDDEGSVHEPDIQLLALVGITAGCDGDGTRYCPNDPVTRAQVATFLARAMGLKPPEDPEAWRFEDTVGHFHEPDIRAIAAEGITRGCNPEGTRFCPDDRVTRAQMAAFIARALDLEAPADSSEGAFEDTVGHVHEDSIRAIAAEGITRGCNAEGTRFCPDDWVSRAQMASFLARAFDLHAATA